MSALDLERFGMTRRDLTRRCESGELRRLRRGVYIRRDVWDQSDADERLRLRVEAELCARPSAVVSHAAALVMHGCPIVDWPERIDVMSGTGKPRDAGGVHIHPLTDVPLSACGRAVSLPVAIVQTAARGWRTTAVVAADHALHEARLSLADLEGARAAWPLFAGRVDAALGSLDGASESPGESLLRLIMTDAGLKVLSQVPIGGYVVDFVVDGVVVEFDGKLKYADDPTGASLFREKRREDALRALGYDVVRVVWHDLRAPRDIVGRILRQRPRVRANP